MLWFTALLLVALVVVPIVVVAVECAFAREAPVVPVDTRPPRGVRSVVCVPAHDEEPRIGAMIDSVRDQLGPDGRILVVAHNCRDRTAAVARNAGVEVLVADDGLEGKVHALRHAIAYLSADPPDIAVIMDADVRADPGAIPSLVRAAHDAGAPVQGRYVFEPADLSMFTRSSRVALLVKNEIRYLGRHRLGLPVLLHGAGWAIPFGLLEATPLRAEAMAEDYQLTVDLLLRGAAVRAHPGAVVRTSMPQSPAAARSQRRRWEHGQIRIALTTAPRLLGHAVRRLDLGAATLALHLIVPPLALLVWLWGAVTVVAAVAWRTGGGAAPLAAAVLAGVLGASSIVHAIARFAGWRAALAGLLRMPGYIATKAPMYVRYLWDRERRWTRTGRDRSA